MKTLEEIKSKVIKFRDERDWRQFHKPKDLALSLSIEAAELMECFQWKTDDEVNELIRGTDRIKVQEEIADVAAYLLLLCESMNIDLLEAIEDKLGKNAKKYPIDKCKGKANKYTDYDI